VLELTQRDIAYEVTRGDLELLYQVAEKVQSRQLSELASVPPSQLESPKPVPEWSELRSILLSHLKPAQLNPSQLNPSLHRLEPQLSPELLQLRKLVRNDARVETIKCDLVLVWLSAEENHPADEMKNKDGVVERPARKEYTAVRWPGSDADVQLRTPIYDRFVKHNASMYYSSHDGELRVFPLSSEHADKEESNKEQLTKFIDRYFKVKPDDLEFDCIANNLISFIPWAMDESIMESALDVARGFGAVPGDVRSVFTLRMKLREDTQPPPVEGVSVQGWTRIGFVNRSNRDHVAVGHVDPSKGVDLSKDVDLSKYVFVRREGFLVSAEHLRSDPAVFDPRANLLSVSRFDTIDWKWRRRTPPRYAAFTPSRRHQLPRIAPLTSPPREAI
jgi:hypothetical protein